MRNKSQTITYLPQLLSMVVVVILVLLPFHALFTTWLGATFGYEDWFKLWKELLITILSFGALALLVTDKKLAKRFVTSFIVQLAILYVLYSILRGTNAVLRGDVTGEALLFGLVVNLRYIVFFVVVWIVAQKSDLLYRYWLWLLLGPAMIVVVFGLMQQFLLEKDVLKHVGYSEETIKPFIAVDNKPEFARLQSTLRGPNPFGAYLTLVVTTLVAWFLQKRHVWIGLGIVLSTTTLLFSYSRSAWLGLIVSFVVLLLISGVSQKVRLIVLCAVLFGVLVSAVTVYALRDNDLVQNTVFHSDENSLATSSSNEVRYRALSGGVTDVVSEPLGRGVGTAGPASVRNDQPARIAENYYLQLAQEVGIIGLLIYISISFMVFKELWWRRHDVLARVLLASFAGITVINFVSHAWADDTLSLLWWGLAGIAIAQPVILKRKYHESQTKKTT